jgi:hypothetical protein
MADSPIARISTKKLLLIGAALAIVLVGDANAGTELQLQFRQWVYEGNGIARVLVSLRNTTTTPFAVVSWLCDLYDKQHYLVGQAPFIFSVVPWGSLVHQSFSVTSNGMFETADCKLAGTEVATERNKKLYANYTPRTAIGLGVPEVRQYFSFERPIQGRAAGVTQEYADEHPVGPANGVMPSN